MEQLTPKEWVKDQLRHAPSFAISTSLLVIFLLVSAFVDLSSGAQKEDRGNVEVGLAAEKAPDPIAPVRTPIPDVIPQQIKPEDMNMPPVSPGEGGGEGGGKGTGTGIGIGPDSGPGDAPVDLVGADTNDVGVSMDDPVGKAPRVSPVIGTKGVGGPIKAFGGRSAWKQGGGGGKGGIANATAILDGLAWLKKVQETDGHWDPTAAKCGAGGNVPNAATGLALLAFLGFGCTDKDPEFGPTVRKAMDYLVRVQGSDGGFGEKMYTQGICTMALAESFGMMPSEIQVKQAAQRGLNFILARQPSTGIIGGFGYDGPGDDMSVTGFQFQALKAAKTVGLEIPSEAEARAEKFLELSINNDGSCSYRVGNKAGAGTLAMTAANLTARIFRGHPTTGPDCVQQAEWLAKSNFQAAFATQNYYTIYYLSLATFNMGGEYWEKWNGKNPGDPSFYKSLQSIQIRTGDFRGAWPGGDYGGAGSCVYSTSLACLSLEVYHRYEKVGDKTTATPPSAVPK